MYSKSIFLRLLCLSLSAIVSQGYRPFRAHNGLQFLESAPPALPFYGPQVPFVAASVKSPPVVASIKSPPFVSVPAPVRARIGVKTVVRPPPPQPAPVPIVQQPVPIIEQHELVTPLLPHRLGIYVIKYFD